MGGSVAVTLREPNGTEHRMSRWTNALPWFVNNMKFVTKDPLHIKDYMARWNEMRADWEKNKDTGKFEFPMTTSYAPHTDLAPDGYGLVVLDMMKNEILTCQGYCKFGVIHTVSIALDSNQSTIRDSLDREEDREHVIAKKFFDDGRATVQKFVKAPLQKRGRLIDTDIGYDKLMEMVKEHGEEYYKHPDIKLDFSPFKIKEYREDTGWLKMRTDIEKLGFKITDEEDKMWNEWIKEKKEMEDY